MSKSRSPFGIGARARYPLSHSWRLRSPLCVSWWSTSLYSGSPPKLTTTLHLLSAFFLVSMTTRGAAQQIAPSTPKRPSKTASSQSLNHLLNFSLPPRQTHQLQSLPRRSRRHGANQAVWNKERESMFCIIKYETYIHPYYPLPDVPIADVMSRKSQDSLTHNIDLL